jgi:hypothetical protein
MTIDSTIVLLSLDWINRLTFLKQPFKASRGGLALLEVFVQTASTPQK